MPKVCRLHDLCTGHPGCSSSRPNIEASTDVFVNSRGAHRQGDEWMIHCGHKGFLAKGSSTVYVNGKQLGRIGDPITCGSLVKTGSDDVFAGG